MIVPMKKVTLLALSSEESSVLTALRSLGVMQVEVTKGSESGRSQQLSECHDTARRVLSALEKYRKEREKSGAEESPNAKVRSGAEAVEQTAQLFDSREKISAELASVQQRLKSLAVWGDFDRAEIDALRAKGIYVYLCCGRDTAFEAAEALENADTQLIAEENGRCYFVVFSTEPIADGVLPEVRLGGEDNPPSLRRRETELGDELRVVEEEISELFASIPSISKRVSQLSSELEFSRVSDSLAEHGEIVSLFGYVPAPSIPALEKAADTNGWGLLIEDPEPGDRVPTLIKTPKWVRTIEPLFGFLGIEPGYDEIDVSAGVLIFFTIFYAMIVGDAGYGLVFLLGTLFAAWKFRGNPAAVLPVRLFTLLSVATIVWGLMTSNIFGMANPSWLKWAEVPQLTDEAVKNQSARRDGAQCGRESRLGVFPAGQFYSDDPAAGISRGVSADHVLVLRDRSCDGGRCGCELERCRAGVSVPVQHHQQFCGCLVVHPSVCGGAGGLLHRIEFQRYGEECV